MRLKDYLDLTGGTISDFAEECGISRFTIHKCINGEALGRYAIAKAISDATDGAVSIEELCEPDE